MTPLISLLLLSFALTWAVFVKAGVWPSDWTVSLAGIGCATTLYWLLSGGTHRAPAMSRSLRCLVFLMPCYVLFQLVPLPIGVLKVISPGRAQLVLHLRPILPHLYAPLTVRPPATVLGLFTILGYTATFLLVRELALRFSARPWLLAVPLIVIAGFEAGLGVVQVFANWPSGQAIGTYVNRDHFAGLLEMVMPLTVLAGLAIVRDGTGRSAFSIWRALVACVIWGIAALLMLAITYSLSRMGFIVALCALFVVGMLSPTPRRRSRVWRWLCAGAVGTAIVLMFVLFPPDRLITRFGHIAGDDNVPGDTRLAIWKDILPLIAEYPIFGCGLGGFESAFLKYQTAAPDYTIAFAHNDYLQYLAELGLVGFILLASLLSAIFAQVFRAAFMPNNEGRRLLLIGCVGAFLTMLLHSMVDFNMYIPANALALTWIAGLGSATALE